MESKIIEKFDRQRYRAVVMESAGLLFIFAETLRQYINIGNDPHQWVFASGFFNLFPYRTLDEGVIPFIISTIVNLIPFFLLICGGIWYGRIWLKTRRNRELHNALYDELYIRSKHCYQRLTLWVTLGLMFITLILAAAEVVPVNYPYVIVIQMLMLVSLLTLKISWLIYNRR